MLQKKIKIIKKNLKIIKKNLKIKSSISIRIFFLFVQTSKNFLEVKIRVNKNISKKIKHFLKKNALFSTNPLVLILFEINPKELEILNDLKPYFIRLKNNLQKKKGIFILMIKNIYFLKFENDRSNIFGLFDTKPYNFLIPKKIMSIDNKIYNYYYMYSPRLCYIEYCELKIKKKIYHQNLPQKKLYVDYKEAIEIFSNFNTKSIDEYVILPLNYQKFFLKNKSDFYLIPITTDTKSLCRPTPFANKLHKFFKDNFFFFLYPVIKQLDYWLELNEIIGWSLLSKKKYFKLKKKKKNIYKKMLLCQLNNEIFVIPSNNSNYIEKKKILTNSIHLVVYPLNVPIK